LCVNLFFFLMGVEGGNAPFRRALEFALK